MPNPTLATLGAEVRKQRGNNTLRDVAKRIGISPATLMRVESGRVPDVETFGKLCRWLEIDPGAYLGFTPTKETQAKSDGLTTVSAHLKADAAPSPDTAHALAKMIMFAVQRQKSSLTNGDT